MNLARQEAKSLPFFETEKVYTARSSRVNTSMMPRATVDLLDDVDAAAVRVHPVTC